MRFFASDFFYEWVSSKSLTRSPKAFRIWLQIRGNICDFLLTLAIVYSRELILPYCLLRRDATPRIVHSGELQIYEFSAETLAYRF
jgi:hypothetical protein